METTNVAAPTVVEYRLFGEMQRGTKKVRVLLGGGTRRERIKGTLAILAWNRWASRDAAKRGVAFPADAPKWPWQVNWISVLQKGNV
jgi:hypothetical protein